MNWHSLLLLISGMLIGYGFFLGRNARHRLQSSEGEAMAMVAASLRELSQRMDQLARMAADRETESDEEMMFAMGQANAFEMVADQLRTLADKVEG